MSTHDHLHQLRQLSDELANAEEELAVLRRQKDEAEEKHTKALSDVRQAAEFGKQLLGQVQQQSGELEALRQQAAAQQEQLEENESILQHITQEKKHLEQELAILMEEVEQSEQISADQRNETRQHTLLAKKHSDDLRDLQEQLRTAQEQAEAARAREYALTDEVEALKRFGDAAAATEKIEMLEQQVEILQSELEEKTRDAQDEVAEVRRELEEEKLARAEEQEDAKNFKSTLVTRFSQQKQKHDEEMEKLQELVGDLKEELVAARSSGGEQEEGGLSSLESEIGQQTGNELLRGKLAEAQEQLETEQKRLAQEKDAHAKAISTLKSDLDCEKASVRELEEKFMTLQTQASGLEAEKNNLVKMLEEASEKRKEVANALRSKEARIDELVAHQSSCQQDAAAAQEKAETLTNRIAALEAERESMKTQHEQALNELDARCNSAESELKARVEELQGVRDELAQREKELRRVKEDHAHAEASSQQQINDLASEKETMQTSLDALGASAKKAQLQADKAVKKLEAQVSSLQAEKDRLENQCHVLQEQTNSLSEKLHAAESREKALAEEVESVKAQLEAVEIEAQTSSAASQEAHRSKLSSMAEAVASLEKDCSSLREELKTQASKGEKAKSQHASQLRAKDDALAAASERVAGLEAELERAESAMKEAKGQYDARHEATAKALAEAESRTRELGVLNKHLTDERDQLLSQTSELQKDLAAEKEARLLAEDKHDTAAERCKALTAQIDALTTGSETRLNDLVAECETMKGELEKARETIDGMKQALSSEQEVHAATKAALQDASLELSSQKEDMAALVAQHDDAFATLSRSHEEEVSKAKAVEQASAERIRLLEEEIARKEAQLTEQDTKHQQRLEESQSQVSDARGAVAELESQLGNATERQQRMQATIDSLEARITGLSSGQEESVRVASEQIGRLEQEKEALAAEKAEAVSALEARLRQAEEERRADVAALQGKLEAGLKDASTATSAAEERERLLKDALASAEAQLEEAGQRNAEAKAASDKAKQRIGELETRIRAMTKTEGKLRAQLATATEAQQGAADALSTMKEETNALHATLGEKDGVILQLRQANEASAAELQTTKAELLEAGATLANAQRRLAKAGEDCAAATKELEAEKEATATLKRQLAEQEIAVATLTREVEALNARLQEHNSFSAAEGAKLEQEVEELKGALKASQADVRAKAQLLAELRLEMEEQKEENETLSEDIEASNIEIEDLEKDLTAANKELLALRSEKEVLAEAQRKAEAKAAQIAREQEGTKAALDARIAALTEQSSTQSTEIQRLQQLTGALEAAASEDARRTEALEAQLTKCKDQLAEKQAALAQLDGERNQLASTVSALEKTVAEQSAQVETMRRAALQAQRTSEDTIAALSKEVETGQRAVGELEASLTTVRTEQEKDSKECARLCDEVAALQRTSAEKDAVIAARDKSISNLQAELGTARQAHDAEKTRRQEFADTIANLEEELLKEKQVASSVVSLETQVASLQQQLKKTQGVVSEKERQNDVLMEDFEKTAQEKLEVEEELKEMTELQESRKQEAENLSVEISQLLSLMTELNQDVEKYKQEISEMSDEHFTTKASLQNQLKMQQHLARDLQEELESTKTKLLKRGSMSADAAARMEAELVGLREKVEEVEEENKDLLQKNKVLERDLEDMWNEMSEIKEQRRQEQEDRDLAGEGDVHGLLSINFSAIDQEDLEREMEKLQHELQHAKSRVGVLEASNERQTQALSEIKEARNDAMDRADALERDVNDLLVINTQLKEDVASLKASGAANMSVHGILDATAIQRELSREDNDALAAELSKSEEAVRRLREEKRALESEKDDMELSLKAELRQLQEKYSGAQAEVDTLARFITELNEEKQQLKVRLGDKAFDDTAVEAALAAGDAVTSQVMDENTELKALVATLKEELAETTATLDEEKAGRVRDCSDLESVVEGLKQEVSDLMARNKELRERSATLREQGSAAPVKGLLNDSVLGKLSAELEQSDKELATLELAKWKKRAAEAEEEAASLSARLRVSERMVKRYQQQSQPQLSRLSLGDVGASNSHGSSRNELTVDASSTPISARLRERRKFSFDAVSPVSADQTQGSEAEANHKPVHSDSDGNGDGKDSSVSQRQSVQESPAMATMAAFFSQFGDGDGSNAPTSTPALPEGYRLSDEVSDSSGDEGEDGNDSEMF